MRRPADEDDHRARNGAPGSRSRLSPTPARHGGKIAIVAAENFYGDVAQQIGGDQVSVASILSNPDQDPHLFEASPSVVREFAGAQIVIYNGADYDPVDGQAAQSDAESRPRT